MPVGPTHTQSLLREGCEAQAVPQGSDQQRDPHEEPPTSSEAHSPQTDLPSLVLSRAMRADTTSCAEGLKRQLIFCRMPKRSDCLHVRSKMDRVPLTSCAERVQRISLRSAHWVHRRAGLLTKVTHELELPKCFLSDDLHVMSADTPRIPETPARVKRNVNSRR